jgi:hypothetical protein
MVALLHYLDRRCLSVTLIEGSDLQPLEKSAVRRGHMDIKVVHVNLTDARVAGKLAMGLWRLVDNRASWRRLVS